MAKGKQNKTENAVLEVGATRGVVARVEPPAAFVAADPAAAGRIHRLEASSVGGGGGVACGGGVGVGGVGRAISTTVDSLRPHVQYKARVAAENALGKGQPCEQSWPCDCAEAYEAGVPRNWAAYVWPPAMRPEWLR